MKILITGANGYLGQGVVKSILNDNHQVIATDINVDRVDDRAIKKECNIFDINNPFHFFDEPDILLHMAWRDGFVHYSDAHIEDLPKHFNFIKEMIKSGIKKVVVLGSMHEIGFYEGSINENTPCNPITPYGISKNALRELVVMLANQYKVNYQWLRGYYIVSNLIYGSSIFSKIAVAESNQQYEFPFTMGENQYDFIDYEDFCYLVTKTVEQNDINGTINICSGKPEKLAHRVEQFIKENNYKIKLKYGAFPDRPYDSKAIWGDDKKIRNILKEES
ncbi:MAG: NAD-dependent epimerase/dehydratase family protein [Thomasclavelia sp.]